MNICLCEQIKCPDCIIEMHRSERYCVCKRMPLGEEKLKEWHELEWTYYNVCNWSSGVWTDGVIRMMRGGTDLAPEALDLFKKNCPNKEKFKLILKLKEV